jgi:hypothetical protein
MKDILTRGAHPQGQKHRGSDASSLATDGDRRLAQSVKTGLLVAYNTSKR